MNGRPLPIIRKRGWNLRMQRVTTPALCLAVALSSAAVVCALEEPPSSDVVPAGFAANVSNAMAVKKSGFSIVPYGAFWADMIYATERTNPGAFTFFVLSEERQGEDTLTIDARRSRFGFNLTGPDIPIDGGLQSGGQLEIDFQGDFIIENRAEMLLRHVYWEAKNDRQRILVGQTWDVLSPLYPRTLNYAVGWLAGNIGFRRAQFRYESFGFVSDDVAWILQSSLNQDIVPDFTTSPGVVRESTNWPVFEARGALKLNPDAGEQATTLGVSGHIGETGFDFLTAGPPPLNLPPVDDGRFETWSYSVDFSAPIGDRASFQAEFFRGRNLSPFLGGVGQGVCPCTRTGIDSIGGWADLRYAWTDFLSTSVGYGVDDPEDGDLLFGRSYNQFIYSNVLVALTDALSTGIEVTYWKTLYQETRIGLVPPTELGPTAPGKAVTIDWMVKYEF
jgi:hypothetical protein